LKKKSPNASFVDPTTTTTTTTTSVTNTQQQQKKSPSNSIEVKQKPTIEVIEEEIIWIEYYDESYRDYYYYNQKNTRNYLE